MKNTLITLSLLAVLACNPQGKNALTEDTSSTNPATSTSTDNTTTTLTSNTTVTTTPEWQLEADHFEAAKLPLEIINPQPGLDVSSYYYRTYPDLAWRVPISVLGGAWPFRYELLDGPMGMALGEFQGGSNYGVLSWPQPIASATPYAVSVQVTDQEGATQIVSWTLTVTTDQTLFVDANNGDDQSGDGSIGNPFQSMAGWYELGAGARNFDTYDNNHVYYRAGTYFIEDNFDPDSTGGGKMPMRQKPNVHLGYPGETAIFDFQNASMFFADASQEDNDDIFFAGLTWQGVCTGVTASWQRGVGMASTDRLVAFELRLGNQGGPGIVGQNPAWFFFINQFPNFSKQHLSFHNNTIEDMNSYLFIESYAINKMVVEGNTSANTVGDRYSRIVYLKVDSSQVTVRDNRSLGGNDSGLIQVGSAVGLYDQVEVAWNDWKVETPERKVLWYGLDTFTALDRVYTYRNTLTNGAIHHQYSTGGGPVWYQNNVRQYGSGDLGLTENQPLFPVEGMETDLIGTAGLVDDVTNLLIGDSRADFLGLKGHEVQ